MERCPKCGCPKERTPPKIYISWECTEFSEHIATDPYDHCPGEREPGTPCGAPMRKIEFRVGGHLYCNNPQCDLYGK